VAAPAETGTASNGPGPWPPASRGGVGHAMAAGFAATAGWTAEDADAVGGGREDWEAGIGAPGMTEADRPP